MSSQTQAFVSEFRSTVAAAARRLEQIHEQDSVIPLAEGKWSPKQIIGHLIDSAANNHTRFVRAQFTEDLVFPGYEQDEWVEVQRYNDEPWEQLVALWKHYNFHLSHLMAAVPEALKQLPRTKHNLDRIAFHTIPADQPVTLYYFMNDYVEHLRHHLKQILGESA
jgi:prephenate dehydratase